MTDYENLRFTWHESDSYKGIEPAPQVYGVCFTNEGKVVIVREPGKYWNIPGGKPESGETPEQTLRREMLEEVSVFVGQMSMIGYYEVTNGVRLFQLRFAAQIIEILPPQRDPATNAVNERKFVSPEEFFYFVEIPDYRPMFDRAISWYNKTQHTKR